MNAPFRIRPFGFDQVFESTVSPLSDANMAELRLRVAALEAELTGRANDGDAAIAEARAQGFEAGMLRANDERRAALLAATDALHAAVEGVEARIDEIADEAARTAAEIARIAAGLIAGRMAEEAPGAAIDAAIGRVLRQVARGQEIHVAVHPDLAGEIERLVATRQALDRRRLAIVVVPDATRPFGDAHIHWERGGVVLDAAARAEAVRVALAPVLGDSRATRATKCRR